MPICILHFVYRLSLFYLIINYKSFVYIIRLFKEAISDINLSFQIIKFFPLHYYILLNFYYLEF